MLLVAMADLSVGLSAAVVLSGKPNMLSVLIPSDAALAAAGLDDVVEDEQALKKLVESHIFTFSSVRPQAWHAAFCLPVEKRKPVRLLSSFPKLTCT
jgi:hypothetical protein